MHLLPLKMPVHSVPVFNFFGNQIICFIIRNGFGWKIIIFGRLDNKRPEDKTRKGPFLKLQSGRITVRFFLRFPKFCKTKPSVVYCPWWAQQSKGSWASILSKDTSMYYSKVTSPTTKVILHSLDYKLSVFVMMLWQERYTPLFVSAKIFS